ncbi:MULTISPECIES: PH domain-containing protein [unclassified Curtobacterium]|uniref:PH domain-containing protein n=1 Tax=unclassified Curtobacterium TaxID=257496 RepID=UPI0011B59677|nr:MULTISPECIES: PH domain-containing protein [unclassified Curtobacterium]
MTRHRTAGGERRGGFEARESLRAAEIAARMVGRIEAWAGGIIVAGGAILCTVWASGAWRTCCWVVAALALLSAVIESVLVIPVAVRNFRVEIVPGGVLVYRGAVFRSVDHIPGSKITLVRRQAGPLLQRLCVAKCVLFTPAREVSLLPMSDMDVERLMQLGADDV